MQEFLNTLVSDLVLVPRLIVALLLTGVLGWDRERKNRPAGLRTHMLVGISACSFVLMAELFEDYFRGTATTFNFDPIRIVQAAVAGVSFLGAGTVFVMGNVEF